MGELNADVRKILAKGTIDTAQEAKIFHDFYEESVPRDEFPRHGDARTDYLDLKDYMTEVEKDMYPEFQHGVYVEAYYTTGVTECDDLEIDFPQELRYFTEDECLDTLKYNLQLKEILERFEKNQIMSVENSVEESLDYDELDR